MSVVGTHDVFRLLEPSGRIMPKVLLISIRPKWVREILSGRKTFELRTRPPKLEEPAQTLIYESSPTCRIRAVCEMGPVLSGTPRDLWEKICDRACISRSDYDAYFTGRDEAHAIEVKDVEELPPVMTLARLRLEADFEPHHNYRWATEVEDNL